MLQMSRLAFHFCMQALYLVTLFRNFKEPHETHLIGFAKIKDSTVYNKCAYRVTQTAKCSAK